ncbi:MAG: ABC transporter permease [Spirochaetes bacterium]|nr:ABC transporter permease [Spirochaetota bacterium]
MKNREIVLKLAWRNVWRNKRRTILTLLTIIVGCSVILFQNAVAKGGHDRMIEDAAATNTGHIQIHEKGYWDNRTIDYAFQPENKLINALKNDERISGYTLRVHAEGLLSFKNSTAGTMIQGVDPVTEKSVSNLHSKILKGGRYLLPGDRNSIIMGMTLAKNIGANVGDTISMISQGFDGSIAAERLTVVGLFNAGNQEYDQGMIIMPISQAEETFSMMGYIHSIALRLRSSSDTGVVRGNIKKHIDNKIIEVLGWEELMPEMVQFIVMDDVNAYIFDFILFMIVAFGILNTIHMSIFERMREFGIMLSIGTAPRQVMGMVLCESLIITILGIIGGLGLGYAVCYYFYVNPLDFSGYANEMAVLSINMLVVPADASMLNGIVTAMVTLILCLLFSVFPARKAAKLNPIDAIRHL